MATAVNNNILLQKVRQGNRLRDVSTVSPSRALRLALARVAKDMWGLAAVSQGIQMDLLDQETALSMLDANHLILVLSSPAGDVALVCISRAALTALIEVQTVGAVFDRPLDDRPFTTTDALMSWVYLDKVFTAFQAGLDGSALAAQLIGYRFEVRADDTRTAGLFLNAAQYRVMTATVDFGPGQRTGDIQFVLPLRDIPDPPARQRATGSADGAARDFDVLPAVLQVVLCRLQLPLSQASALKPGQLLPLPADALNRAELVTVQGRMVSKGRLGQINGFRAIRLDLPARPNDLGDQTGPTLNPDVLTVSQSDMEPDIGMAGDEMANNDDMPSGMGDFAVDTAELDLSDAASDIAEVPLEDSEDLSDLVGLEDFPDWDAAALED